MGKFTKTSSPMEMEAVDVLLPSPPPAPCRSWCVPKGPGVGKVGAEGDTCTSHKLEPCRQQQ